METSISVSTYNQEPDPPECEPARRRAKLRSALPPVGRGWRTKLLLLILLFLLVRLAVLATSLHLYHPEEAQNGTLGTDFAAGPTLPPLEYIGPTEAYEGGIVVNGFAAALVFTLFGQSGVSLKLVWLTYATVSFVLLVLVTRRAFGDRAALFTGLFAVASPAFFIYMNLSDTMVDSGALCCSTVVLYTCARVLDGQRPSHLGFGLLGLACGLAMFFSYHTLTMSFTALCVGVLPRSRRLVRYIPALAAGGLLGLTPWLVFNLGHDFWGIGFFASEFDVGFRGSDMFTHLAKVVFSDLPAVFGGVEGVGPLESRWLGAVFQAGFIASLAFLWGHAFSASNRGRATPVMLGCYPIVFLLVYAASAFDVGRGAFGEYRHMLSLMPTFFVAMGVSAAWVLRAWTAPRRRAPALAVGLLVAAVGAAGVGASVGMLSAGNCNLGPGSIYPARLWPWLAHKTGLFAGRNPKRAAGIVESMTRKHAPYDYPSEDMLVQDADGLARFMRSLDEPLYSALALGAGTGLGRYAYQDTDYLVALKTHLEPRGENLGRLGTDPALLRSPRPASEGADAMVDRLPRRFGVEMCRAIGAASGPGPSTPDIGPCAVRRRRAAWMEGKGMAAAAERCKVVEGPPEEAFWEGAGVGIGLSHLNDAETLLQAIRGAHETHRAAFVRGLGVALGWHLLNDPTLLMRLETEWFGAIPPDDPLTAREYEYLPLHFAALFETRPRVRLAVLRGLGRGYARHVCSPARLVVLKLVDHFSRRCCADGRHFFSGLEEGVHDSRISSSDCRRLLDKAHRAADCGLR